MHLGIHPSRACRDQVSIRRLIEISTAGISQQLPRTRSQFRGNSRHSDTDSEIYLQALTTLLTSANFSLWPIGGVRFNKAVARKPTKAH